LVPVLLLLAALGACGADDSGAARDPEVTSPTGGPTSSDNGTAGGAVDFELVDTITVTSAGGELSDTAVPLSGEAAVQSFVAQFTAGDLADQVENAVAQTDVPPGQQLYGAVVAIGCDAPDQVTVARSGSDVVITPVQVPSPKSECFAPMTTVALVLVPTAPAS